MSDIVYIGIDDTDVPGSPGTGRVARGLAQRLSDLGLAVSLGVSRHQLLVDDRIKYTSHNSAKGIALRTERPVSELYQPGIAYMLDCLQAGADPGLCICSDRQINDEVVSFGQMALTTVLSKHDATGLAAQSGIFLKELGGSGDGAIGALAAVGLRAGGNEGRLIDLRGIHEIKGLISVGELKARTEIDSVQDPEGKVLGDADIINSLDWIRPSLVGGRAVIRVRPAVDPNSKQRIWLPVEIRHNQQRRQTE